MRGRYNNSQDKWLHINQVIRSSKTGILVLQETHLTREEALKIESLFSRLHIISSIETQNTNTKGVAIVINRDLLNSHHIQEYDLIPGRALMVQLQWHRETKLNVLVVYAPNDSSSNGQFWKDLHTKIQSTPKPDVLLGDFNMVEDAIDRLPTHRDNPTATEPLADLKTFLLLNDGWRKTFPTDKSFTFHQSARQGGAQSCIDRIYVNEDLMNYSKDWTISPPGIAMDHQLVSVRISNQRAPFVGKGRWTMPLFLLKDKEVMCEIKQLGRDLELTLESVNTARTAERNPQVLFQNFKDKITQIYRTKAKTAIPKLDLELRKLKTLLNKTLNESPPDKKKQLLASLEIQNKINYLERLKHSRLRDNLMAKNKLEAETAASKYWSQLGKQWKSREPILELKIPDSLPPKYETRSDKMAELARNYHDSLQSQHIAPRDIKEAKTKETLDYINTQLEDQDKDILKDKISEGEILEIIKHLPNDRATGLDGIPYEFWRKLQEEYQKDSADNQMSDKSFNIAKTLTLVFNDIENHGLIEGSRFAEGWLCPLFKKNDCRDIANYRPITILNSDYKILAKSLATKLALTVPTIIHANQAGFIPGRSITNQIRLTQMILDFAEAEDCNGAIVGLDQEKVYDKITHDYLWQVLEKYELPQQFIRTIKTLYRDAKTSVMINGELSTKYKLTRDVCQGNPLSCLLFNLAIEPLAEMLRKSNLRGFKAPGMPHSTVVSLFADDTTVYLTENDSFEELTLILDNWCKASGAKFNISKTEIIPIGSEDYRKQLYDTRKLHPDQPAIQQNMSIAKDGEAKRMLGAWIGNKTQEEGVWTPTMEQINSALNRWERTYPTIEGHKIIVQWVIGGLTQYLSVVQGMPVEIEKQLKRRIRTFIWNNEGTPLVADNTLQARYEEGGKGVLDISAHNAAIQLNWLKTYLQQDSERPTWAFFTDALIAKQACSTPVVHPNARINVFLQTWKPRTKNTTLPLRIVHMLKTAKQCELQFDFLTLCPQELQKLPIWFHLGADKGLNQFNNHYYAPCLRNKHQIITVGQMSDFANSSNTDHDNEAQSECHCTRCQFERQELNCENPNECHRTARRIMECLNPKWNPNRPTQIYAPSLTTQEQENNLIAAKTDQRITFNPTLITHQLGEGFRIFTGNLTRAKDPAEQLPPTRPPDDAQNNLKFTTSSMESTDEYATRIISGAAFFGRNDPRNVQLKMEANTHTKDEGELAALYQAIKSTPKYSILHIEITSKSIIMNITVDLRRNEKQGWLRNKDSPVYKAIVAELRQRPQGTTFIWSTPNNNQTTHKTANDLAKEAIQRQALDRISIEIRENFDLRGLELASGSQALFYQYLRECKRYKEVRRRTLIRLDITRHAIKKWNGTFPTDEQIWNSLRNKDIPRNIRGFLYKNMHDTYRIGHYWAQIPNYEQ